jgi:hypothetical protein
MVFTVQLSKVSATAVTFNIATADGTATSPSDYTAKSATMIISAGTLSKTFSVAVKGDTLSENDEDFTANLSNASGAAIADGQAVGTILTDD